jgi:hypothetical protein
MRIAREITGGGAAGLVLGLSLRIIVVLCASPRIPAIETAAPQLPQTTEDRAGSQMAADILRQCRCNVKETDVPSHAPSVRWSCDCLRSPPKDDPQVSYFKRLTNLPLDFQSVTDLVTQDKWRRPITSHLCPEMQIASWRSMV